VIRAANTPWRRWLRAESGTPAPGGTGHAGQRDWKLQERERVALRFGQKTLAHPRGERREAISQQRGRGGIVERAEVVGTKPAPLEEILVP
jgi:hypothetical protein